MACILALPLAERPAPPKAGPTLERWLSTQKRLVDAWIDQLVAENGDVQLIAVLDQHARFLNEASKSAIADGP